jgi:ATP-dependent helicase/nuclease subunit B
MSLRFYFGPSGSGKSHRIYEEIMQRAAQEPGRNFLIIVPDQFTMQTQKDLVMRSDRGGILNIDVLSFGRLSHRILEEVGTKEMPVLDDTGKSLVLQKIAADLKEQLPAMGSLLHKQGYIHEVKSAISEFMQYGISTQDMDKLIASAEKRGALAMKLRDLKTLYRGFQDYIRDNSKGNLSQVVMHDCAASTQAICIYCTITGYSTTISTACSSNYHGIQNSMLQQIISFYDGIG